jgi:DNA-binding transcriptional LysR family regulator
MPIFHLLRAIAENPLSLKDIRRRCEPVMLFSNRLISMPISGTIMDQIERIERRLKLHDVRVLMSVVQAGSMHKAAERLATSQSAVSRAIADLEHALGVRLLDRSPSGIEPTQYAHAIIKRGLVVFDELRQSLKDIEFLTDPTLGELRIGCSEQAAGGPVLAVIDRLTRRHPRMVFDVVTGPVPTVYRDLSERRVELVIQRVVESVVREDMIVERLFDDDIVAVAATQNPWTRRRRIELAELVNEPWTLPPHDTGIGAFAMDAFRARGLKFPRVTVITYSMHMRNKLLATGRFLTMWSRHTLMFPGKNPTLKALSVELDSARGAIAIITLKNRTLSPLAELFIKDLRAIAKPLAQTR